MPKATPSPDQLHMDGSTRQQKLYDSAIDLLRLAVPEEGYYLATSFGKDSIVAQRLCDEAEVKYDAHHNITGIDPPELVHFGRKYYPDVSRHAHRPIELNGRTVPCSMWRLIEKKKILPMRNIRFCCEFLKEYGGRGRRCVMGIRAEESDRRKKSWAPFSTRNGNNGDKLRMFDNDDISKALHNCVPRGTLVVNPMYDWTWADLWDFIKDRKMLYCSLYDEGFERLGCIGCPMAGEDGRRHEFERWSKFYDMYLYAVQRLLNMGKFTNFGSAEDVMDWWLSDKTQEKLVDGQLEMEQYK